jgi:hypothetical protein
MVPVCTPSCLGHARLHRCQVTCMRGGGVLVRAPGPRKSRMGTRPGEFGPARNVPDSARPVLM